MTDLYTQYGMTPSNTTSPTSGSAPVAPTGNDLYSKYGMTPTSSAPIEQTAAPNPAADHRNTLMDAISGFNTGVGNLVNRGLQLASPEGSGLNNMATSSMQNMGADYAQAQQSSPIASRIGYGAGQVAGSLPLMAATGVGGATLGSTALSNIISGGVSGGLIGALNTNKDQSLEDQLIQTAGGVAAGGLLNAGVGATIQGIKGFKLRSTNDPDFVPNLAAATAQKAGIDPANITLQDTYDGINTLHDNTKAIVNLNFGKVSQIADAEGALVNRPLTKNLFDQLTVSNAALSTPSKAAALQAAEKAYGNGVPLSYDDAYSGVKGVYSSAQAAYKSGDLVMGKAIDNVGDTLLSDINNSMGSPELIKARQTANQFFADKYIPLRDLKMGTSHLSDEAWTDNFVKTLGKNDDYQTAYNIMPPALQNQIYAMHVKALQPAMDAMGNINPLKYVTNIQNAMQEAKMSPDLQAHADDLKTLTDTLRYVGTANKFVPPDIAHPTSVLEALPKTTYLTQAGRALQNPEVAELVRMSKSLGDNTSQVVKDTIGQKISRIAWRGLGYGSAGAYATNKILGAESKPIPDSGGGEEDKTTGP